MFSENVSFILSSLNIMKNFNFIILTFLNSDNTYLSINLQEDGSFEVAN